MDSFNQKVLLNALRFSRESTIAVEVFLVQRDETRKISQNRRIHLGIISEPWVEDENKIVA